MNNPVSPKPSLRQTSGGNPEPLAPAGAQLTPLTSLAPGFTLTSRPPSSDSEQDEMLMRAIALSLGKNVTEPVSTQDSSIEPCTKAAKKRLLNEFKNLQNDSDQHINFYTSPDENDIMKWNAVIFGAHGSLYENGIFKLVMIFCHEYPYKPPHIKFLSRIFHPNMSPDGTVCPEILKRNWSPATTVPLMIKSLISLLDNPCLDDETNYNPKAADLFQTNKLNYTIFVNDCVDESLDDDDNINEGMYMI